MIPSEQFGQIPRVGVEIEVVHWGDPKTTKPRAAVCRELIDNGYMDSSLEAPFENNYHNYNCRCHVCNRWENADMDPYPVQFTLEYDASLPDIGGEFITSPFAMLDYNYQSFLAGWDLITNKAVRDMKMKNRDGNGLASPSVHIHSSCYNPKHYDPEVFAGFFRSFSPEIFGFATCTGLDRGMRFRHTDFESQGMNRNYAHHRFLNLKPIAEMGRAVGPHAELRVWEAEYNVPEYIRGALHISAGLTQLASNAVVANKMIAYTVMADRYSMTMDDAEVNCNPLLGEVQAQFLDILYDGLTRVTYISTDQTAYDAVTWMFNETRRFLNVG